MTPMTPVTPEHRAYFALVGSFALWVGLWGYFYPADVARAIPWPVPPLHARFLGAMYFSAVVLMGGSLLSRHVQAVAVTMVAIWTGMLLVVSLLHLSEFDFSRRPVWFWFFAYIVYPFMGARIAWLYRNIASPRTARRVDRWVPGYFTVQGVLLLILAAVLFFVPAWMVANWPWKISPLLAQIYSGPFLSYGVGSLLVARKSYGVEIRIAAASMLTFALLMISASFLHRGLFAMGSASAFVWFGGLVISAVCLSVISVRSLRSRAPA